MRSPRPRRRSAPTDGWTGGVWRRCWRPGPPRRFDFALSPNRGVAPVTLHVARVRLRTGHLKDCGRLRVHTSESAGGGILARLCAHARPRAVQHLSAPRDWERRKIVS
ncbi:unnamed protein product [Lampetra planeri]